MSGPRRRLPLVCASTSDGRNFVTSPCDRGACHWFDRKEGQCSAGTSSAKLFEKWFTPARDAKLPYCPITESCAWERAARAREEPGCFVRRLGLVCEHQAGKRGVSKRRAIWSTWDMADPNDPCWGRD